MNYEKEVMSEVTEQRKLNPEMGKRDSESLFMSYSTETLQVPSI